MSRALMKSEETSIWSCGFSKRQAFVQAVLCIFVREGAPKCSRACACFVQMDVEMPVYGGIRV